MLPPPGSPPRSPRPLLPTQRRLCHYHTGGPLIGVYLLAEQARPSVIHSRNHTVGVNSLPRWRGSGTLLGSFSGLWRLSALGLGCPTGVPVKAAVLFRRSRICPTSTWFSGAQRRILGTEMESACRLVIAGPVTTDQELRVRVPSPLCCLQEPRPHPLAATPGGPQCSASTREGCACAPTLTSR